MIPHIPNQRQNKKSSKPFDDLVSYIEEAKEKDVRQPQNAKDPLHPVDEPFGDILEYTTNPKDSLTSEDKCIAMRTHGITNISTASIEMNAVAAKNARCKSPAYHFILSWPEHERPESEAVFDAAEHAIKALGLGEHQYVIAIHANTDNLHCHIAVNRINPTSFKSKNIEWAQKTLHMAARQSELIHGWSHDNGIYIVEVDEVGRKRIILNPDYAQTADIAPHAHKEDIEHEEPLPTWHDPESLESWLKSKVAKDFKRALPQLGSWLALHSWLSNYDIKLSDSGGGGMRLRAKSPETGEEFDIAASKGLKLLKRVELEKRWGKFRKAYQIDAVVPDLSHLNPIDIEEGINDVLSTSFDEGIPPYHILHAPEYPGRFETDRGRSVHELPAGGLDVDRPDGNLLLPYPLQEHMGDRQARHDQNLRRAGPVEKSGRSTSSSQGSEGRSERSLRRDGSRRAERKAERAGARADLRLRFSQYKKFVALGDTGEEGYVPRLKRIRAQRSGSLKDIRGRASAAKAVVRKTVPMADRLSAVIEIDANALRQTLQVEADFKAKHQALQATRLPPLTWREWLHEQSKLGDEAALSALRGIVYQAQRDAAKQAKTEPAFEIEQEPGAKESSSYREEQFQKAMARLLEAEKKENAIRAAQSSMMRPYETDALLARYAGIQWSITGNGNVKYSDQAGKHLFTDRGNRITFDRSLVTDNEIRLALAHAQQKFGRELTLTGDDPAFTQRMARLADDMGMTILNPELQKVITQHRIDRALSIIPASRVAPAEPVQLTIARPEAKDSELQPKAPDSMPITPMVVADPLEVPEATSADQAVVKLVENEATAAERLRALVMSIDPRATFVTPDSENSKLSFYGVVVAALEGDLGFAQHIGRGVYALHPSAAPADHGNTAIEVKYAAGKPVAKVSKDRNGQGRGD